MSNPEKLAALLASIKARSSYGNPAVYNNALFPVWSIPQGSTAKLRFVPDGDTANRQWWVQRDRIHLPFTDPTNLKTGKTYVAVPTDGNCAIMQQCRAWFKEEGKESVNGRAYWKKPKYLMHGFVRSSTFVETDRTGELREFILSPQLQKLIVGFLEVHGATLTATPDALVDGISFNVTRGSKAGFADYSTSGFARNCDSLTDAEFAVTGKNGELLPKLSARLDAPLTPEVRKVIEDMFVASYDGHEYDESRWGEYFKPIKLNE